MIRPMERFEKKLSEIARYLGAESSSEELISGICSNSKEIEPGDLFVAIPGTKSHGANFVDFAIKQGAKGILTDAEGRKLAADKLPLIEVIDVRKAIGSLSNWFYKSPSSQMNLVGITGTNGKTTTSYLLNQIWKFAGRSTALVGTLGIEICGEKSSSGFTTPESDQIVNILAAAAEKHVSSSVMEVSSIAIEMGRIDGLKFEWVAFSNLTQDHLDFHGSMENYGKAKAKLFDLSHANSAIINIDDPFGNKLFENIKIPVVSISRDSKKAEWHFSKIEENFYKKSIAIRGTQGILIEGDISIIGDYNLDNLLMAVALAFYSGVDPLVISAALPQLKSAPGRMETIDVGQDFLAIVDYAHTPDAVANALRTARKLSKRVIAILGCGGDRDPLKRPIMGAELSKGSDLAIFTSDNPRFEDAEKILNEMMSDIETDKSNVRISDRHEAIRFAAKNATKGDCLIVLGKGHELGQEIAGKKFPFDDRVELAKAIEGLK